MKNLAWLLTAAALSLLLGLLWFEPTTCQSDPLLSCFNQRAIDPDQDWSHYSFVALGHIRTGPKQQGPNRNLQQNFERIFVEHPAFVITLGDLYYSISEKSIANIKRWTSQSIPVPVFNAVGNHDTQTASGHDSILYASAFGNPSFDFILGSELYIFLENGRTPILSPQQEDHLENLLSQAASDAEIRNIFIISHQLFWSYYNPALEPVFRYRHPVNPPIGYRYFLDTLKPLLESLPEGKKVFLMAGDIGGGSKFLQTFFHRDGLITYIASGMGNPIRDSFITVTISNGEVSLKRTNFSSGDVSSLEPFGLEYWRTFYQENPDFAAGADRSDNSQ
ncbi:metallophosphoesterase [Halioglobus sp.]|nr:metallophosphoesterase [Halioglobus sp.]